MPQNLASTHFNTEQWAAVDAALDQFIAALELILVTLGLGQRKRIVRMGDGSEAFVRKTIDVAADNPSLMPAGFDLAELRRDMDTHDALHARYVRLTHLMERIRDTDAALGSDAMAAALQAYQFLKVAGKDEGVESLRQMLGERFEGNGNRKPPATTQA